MKPSILAAIGLMVAAAAVPAGAQQATIATPFHSLNDSFFEHIGAHWSFNWGDLHVQFGTPNIAAPQFGGFDPNAGLRTGWYQRGPDWDFGINFWAAQGSSRSHVSQVPSVTLMNGQMGIFSDTSQSPFVISFIPVVGGFPAYGVLAPRGLPPPRPMPLYYGLPGGLMAVPDAAPMGGNERIEALRQQLQEQRAASPHALPDPPAPVAPLDSARAQAHQRQVPPPPAVEPRDQAALAQNGAAEPPLPASEAAPPAGPGALGAAQQSSAGRAVPSVAEAARMHQIEQAAEQEKAQALFERGLAAEQSGKLGVARIYYHSAAQRASGQLREEALRRLAALPSPGQP